MDISVDRNWELRHIAAELIKLPPPCQAKNVASGGSRCGGLRASQKGDRLLEEIDEQDTQVRQELMAACLTDTV